MSLMKLVEKCKACPECKEPEKLASNLYHHDFGVEQIAAAEARGISFSKLIDVISKWSGKIPQIIAVIKDIIGSMPTVENIAPAPAMTSDASKATKSAK